ncbi:hypothetical protein IM543_12190 [Massilia sp. UMI-21]|nr:hypothetical protein IM543_12190 [Massilia sp. UMI-21]
MIRRAAFCMLTRVLLSLVLLLSQQMAMAHALSHWTSQLGGPVFQTAPNDAELSSAFAQDRGCAQCLGLAQLASPLPTTPRQWVPPALADVPALDAGAQASHIRQARAFDSRAPPVLG